MASKAGGGIRSNKNVSPSYKHGRAAMEKRPAGVSQFGSAMGNHGTGSSKPIPGAVENVRGNRTPISGELGNRVAEQTTCGPGGSRVVMKTGSQGCR
jgi:hypothetical protein